MGWGWLEKIVDQVHGVTKYVDPVAHYSLDLAHQSSTDIVNETSRAIENAFGKDTWLGGVGEHWKNMSQKDKDDFSRWATNTGLTAAAVYGGMAAAGEAGAGGAAGAGAGEGAAAGYGGATAAEAGVAGGSGGWAAVGGDALAGAYPSLEGGAMAGYGGGTAAESGVGGAMGYGGTAAGGAGGAGGGSNGYVGAATQGLNALLSAYQSKKAADAMQAGGDAANATQRYMFDTINAQGAPYRQTAYNALDRINGLQRDPSSVMRDPGYEFGRSQGMRGIDNSASARGGIGGAAIKAGSRFNTDYATTKLNDVYARNFQAAGLANGANALSGSAGMNMANQVGGTQRYMGEAQAGNYMNQGNIYGNALNAIGAYYSRPGG